MPSSMDRTHRMDATSKVLTMPLTIRMPTGEQTLENSMTKVVTIQLTMRMPSVEQTPVIPLAIGIPFFESSMVDLTSSEFGSDSPMSEHFTFNLAEVSDVKGMPLVDRCCDEAFPRQSLLSRDLLASVSPDVKSVLELRRISFGSISTCDSTPLMPNGKLMSCCDLDDDEESLTLL
eukprot:gnl/MRDRNA2_/MRDRNA2_71514_c0_seq1.p1 gnl/MRDRNA2_/MRDRNA2_71514_c0~~gnl/MRDRNA2_/MRDRNA2_71514_c0_seq1.p1  ORF type:complete len:176 (+),score=22.00 gnl/MRDRNA2_/MRDRNA2_71514_c0_seq1:131-658(+)